VGSKKKKVGFPMITSNNRTKMITLCALFTAFTAICSQIQIPLPMVPINLALFSIHLTAILLGGKYGTFSVLAYILLGLIGAPVFAGFTGGVGILFGKTGGYIIGYLLDVLVIALLLGNKKASFAKLCLAMAAGTLACYAFGTVWFMLLTKMGLWTSLVYCVFPFLPGDAVKILLCAAAVPKLQRALGRKERAA
jgi:biotin transport system substrate-specific component